MNPDVQKLSPEIENEYIDEIWNKIEALDQTKLIEEAKRINSLKKRLKTKPRSLQKRLDEIYSDASELSKLLGVLKFNNDRFLETWDASDPLLGAYSATEFIGFDFLKELDEAFDDPGNKKFIGESATEIFNIEDWINSLPSKLERIRAPPPNKKGKLLKRLKTLTKDDLNPFHIRRKDILDEIEINYEDVIYEYEVVKRQATPKNPKIRNVMTYFFDYIKFRIDRSLPWAICGQFIGFVACPPTYRTLIFNAQDGYFNANYLTGVFSDKTIEDFFRTLEGKMLIKSFPERYTHNGKGIPGAYHFSNAIARTFSDSFVWSELPGISFQNFKGTYVHPEILESFASYLGMKTYDWVMPNLRYLRLNPARYINGDSWFIAIAGTISPNYPIRIKPLQKHLALWIRTDEDPFLVHLSFGDKWYIYRTLKQPNAKLIVEFFGILDDDYPKVEEVLSAKGVKNKYKTWIFEKWFDIKEAIVKIYHDIDRAYYGYDNLKDYNVKLIKDVLLVREKPFLFQGPDEVLRLTPVQTFEVQQSLVSNDYLFGDVSDYIVNNDELKGDFRTEFFDEYQSFTVYQFGNIKTFPEVTLKDQEYKDKTIEMNFTYPDTESVEDLIEWKENVKSGSICPPGRNAASERRMGTLASVIGAEPSEFGDPLLIRERRKMLLRASIVTYLIKKYNEKHNELEAKTRDPDLTSDQKIKAYEDYIKKYPHKNHEKEFMKEMIKVFYNLEESDLLRLKQKYPVEEKILNVMKLDEDFMKM